MKKVLAFLVLMTSITAYADQKYDRLGEALFFGRNTENSTVVGPQGNLVEDKHGDVKVVYCSPGKWTLVIDPNRCGLAMSRGQMFCTELATSITGSWSNTFKAGNHYIVNKKTREQMEILSVGDSTYSIKAFPNQPKVKIKKAAKPMPKAEREYYCR